jgi:hypothetical protein
VFRLIDESALRDEILKEPHIHAFVILGTNRDSKFYFSHTPMLHNPVHTYQVIFEGEFDRSEDMEKYLQKREELRKKGERPDNAVIIANPNQVQSFEKILNIPTLTDGSFIGEGFEGLGFEDGEAFKKPSFMKAKINIKKVLLFQQLNPNTHTYPNFLTYYLYGSGSELYVSHVLTKAPNFEQEREIELLEPKNINFGSENILKIEVSDVLEKDNQLIRDDPIKEERKEGYKINIEDGSTGKIKFNKYQWIEINILNMPHQGHTHHNPPGSPY